MFKRGFVVKVDIIRALQRKEGLLFSEAEQIVNDLIDIMKETLESGDEILISGFGKFCLRDKKARPGRDPKSHRNYVISKRRVVTFSPSKVWRAELSEK